MAREEAEKLAREAAIQQNLGTEPLAKNNKFVGEVVDPKPTTVKVTYQNCKDNSISTEIFNASGYSNLQVGDKVVVLCGKNQWSSKTGKPTMLKIEQKL